MEEDRHHYGFNYPSLLILERILLEWGALQGAVLTMSGLLVPHSRILL